MTTQQKHHYKYFLVTVLFFGIATALFRGILDNYLAEILQVSKANRGILEFFRELPGLFLVVLLALFYRTPENRILTIGYVIAFIGVVGFMVAGENLIPAVILLMVWSTGQHLIMPVRQSFMVHSVEKGNEGKALGTLRSFQSIGQVAGYLIVPLIFFFVSGIEGYHISFYLIIALVGCAVLFSLRLKQTGEKIKRQRIYFNRKYNKYYLLQSFYGARKQVFLTFGPYVLILMYSTSAATIATLMGICAALNIFISPQIGKIIDKIGYKKVMVGDTIILFFVCLVYGFAHHVFSPDVAYIAVVIVFILDRLLSNASMAGSVYVKALSDDREEMTATLTTGLSIDHLISIFIALGGGLIWEHFGIEMLFISAGVMALANSAVALTVKVVKR